MTFGTHKRFSISFAYLAAIFVYAMGLSQINYYLTIPILVLMSKYGALFPDVDHHWGAVKEKNILNRIINTLIRITGGKHRSWQTHSLDIALSFTAIAFMGPHILFSNELINEVNREVLSILMIAFSFGWLSHLFSDMLTSDGVRIVFWSKKKLALVPKKIGKLRFNTGNEWEGFVYTAMQYINVLAAIICFVYPILGNDTVQEKIQILLNMVGV